MGNSFDQSLSDKHLHCFQKQKCSLKTLKTIEVVFFKNQKIVLLVLRPLLPQSKSGTTVVICQSYGLKSPRFFFFFGVSIGIMIYKMHDLL